MSDHKKTFNTQKKESAVSKEVETAESKEVEKSTDVTLHNSSARPITLIANRTLEGKVTILPTETVQIKVELWDLFKANKAAQTYFTSGELRKV